MTGLCKLQVDLFRCGGFETETDFFHNCIDHFHNEDFPGNHRVLSVLWNMVINYV